MDFLNLLSQYRTPAGDVFFQGITLLAQETFVVVVICWLFWCSNKKLAYCLGITNLFHFRASCPGIKNNFSRSPSLASGSGLWTGCLRSARRNRILFSKRSHTEHHGSSGNTGTVYKKKARPVSVRAFYSACRLFPYVSGLSYSSGCNCIFPGNFPVRDALLFFSV